MKIERYILVFKKNDDKLFKEISVINLDITILKEIFTPLQNDPNFYDPYRINNPQYNVLVNYCSELKKYPFDAFELYLQAYEMPG